MHHAKNRGKKGNPFSNAIEDASTIMRYPFSEYVGRDYVHDCGSILATVLLRAFPNYIWDIEIPGVSFQWINFCPQRVPCVPHSRTQFHT